MFLLQILSKCLQATHVVATHAVVVCNCLLLHINGCQAPVNAQEHWDQNERLTKDVSLLCPSSYTMMATFLQLWVEKC